LRIAGGDIMDRVPMGTTVVVALLRGEMVDLAALGDSRIYLVTPSGSSQLSPDMNYGLMRMVERDPSELPSPEDAALTHYLGHFDENGRPQLPPVWHRRIRILPGESLVLCSDGVPDYATPLHAEFSQLVARTVGTMMPLASARHLIATANDGGGGDNATAIVAKLRAL
jgi:protein phosphatase